MNTFKIKQLFSKYGIDNNERFYTNDIRFLKIINLKKMLVSLRLLKKFIDLKTFLKKFSKKLII